MLILALDTATPDLVVGLVEAEPTGSSSDTPAQPTARTVREEVLKDSRHHNELLIPTVQQVLRQAEHSFQDLDAVVVGLGPGPFTGLRVGIATAQALADALDIPVYGVCTLDAIAHDLRAADPSAQRFLVATDARRREVYWAKYSSTQRLEGPDVMKPAEVSVEHIDAVSVPQQLADAVLKDSEARVYDLGPRPLALVAQARLDQPPQPIQPLYLRRPDAVPPKPRPTSPAIPPQNR